MRAVIQRVLSASVSGTSTHSYVILQTRPFIVDISPFSLHFVLLRCCLYASSFYHTFPPGWGRRERAIAILDFKIIMLRSRLSFICKFHKSAKKTFDLDDNLRNICDLLVNFNGKFTFYCLFAYFL